MASHSGLLAEYLTDARKHLNEARPNAKHRPQLMERKFSHFATDLFLTRMMQVGLHYRRVASLNILPEDELCLTTQLHKHPLEYQCHDKMAFGN